MKPIVIDLMDMVEAHGAERAEVRKTIRNLYAPPGEAHIIDTTVTLFGCQLRNLEYGNTRQRTFPIAQGAVIDESRYIAHQVAKRLER